MCLLACESSPPASKVCLYLEDAPENRRAFAGYYAARHLVDPIADRPFESERVCLPLRPAQAPVPEDWFFWPSQDESEAVPAWPIEVVIYADRNDNRRFDAGEATGRLATEGFGLPSWVPSWEGVQRRLLRSDPTLRTAQQFGPFPVLSLWPEWPEGGSGLLASTPKDFEVSETPLACGQGWPRCVPTFSYDDEEYLGTEYMLHPALSGPERDSALRRVSNFDQQIPFEPVDKGFRCFHVNGLLIALAEEVVQILDAQCVCSAQTKDIYVFAPAERQPEWLKCPD
jgi:hypothetical protein